MEVYEGIAFHVPSEMLVKIKTIQRLFFYLLFHMSAYTAELSTVIITLENQSTQELFFERAEVKYSGNTLKIDKITIRPQEIAFITGTTTTGYDLSGRVYFKNQKGHFFIEDRRQFHSGQPVFSMHSNTIYSKVTSKTYNPVTGPKLLSYVAATVILRDKI